MRKWAIIRKSRTYVACYDSIAQAAERNGIPASEIKQKIRDSGEWKRVRRVYKVTRRDGSEALCYSDGDDSRWWFPVDGSALRKVDACGYVDVTEEYYQARDL